MPGNNGLNGAETYAYRASQAAPLEPGLAHRAMQRLSPGRAQDPRSGHHLSHDKALSLSLKAHLTHSGDT